MKVEGNFVITRITSEMKGKRCIFPVDNETIEATGKFPLGERLIGKIKNIHSRERRSLRQHNLFMACCGFVAENTEDQNWDTKKKVVLNVQYLQKEPEPINFDSMEHLDACEFYTKGMYLLSAKIGMEFDEFINAVKSRMGGRVPCVKCGGLATQNHHKFPQTDDNVDAYGRKLIDAEWNIEPYCANCHASHNNLKEPVWSEFEFRYMMRQNGYNTDDYPGTKSFRERPKGD